MIDPGKVVLVNLGISIQLPKNLGGFVLPRSGLATKHLISPINSPGLIDPGYTGELMVPLMNYSDIIYTVKRHDRIAQLVAITTSNLIIMLYPIPLKLLAHLSFDSALSLWKLSQTIQFFDHQQKYQVPDLH